MDYPVALFEALVDQVGSPLCVVSADDHVISTNRRWDELFGQAQAGSPIDALFPGAERLTGALAAVRSGTHVEHIRLDGSGEATVSAVPVDGGTGALISVVPPVHGTAAHDDGTERLVRMIAHDLRGPITVVMTQAQLLRRKPDRPDLVTNRAEMISRNCMRLDQAISDLVDVVGLESGRFVLGAGKADIIALIREVLARSGGAIDVSRVTTDLVGETLMVDGDSPRLERMLSNAIEYVVRGTSGPVEVDAHLTEGWAIVLVKPRSSEPKDTALAPPVVSAPAARPYEPLNLFVARRLAEAHTGELRLENDGQEERVLILVPAEGRSERSRTG